MHSYVYYFGAGKAAGDASMKALLGGKGANLAEMTNLGIPVPAGFTITTEVCTHYYTHKRSYPKGIRGEVDRALARVHGGYAGVLHPLSHRSGGRRRDYFRAHGGSVCEAVRRRKKLGTDTTGGGAAGLYGLRPPERQL